LSLPSPPCSVDEDGFLSRGSARVNDETRARLARAPEKGYEARAFIPETCVHLFMFQPSSAPGREGNSAPAAPANAPANAPSEGQSSGPPPDGGGGGLFGGSGFTMLLPLVAFMVIMIWSQRSQAKKQKAIEEGIKVGEKVVTTTGMIGKVTEVGDRVTLEIAPGVRAQFLKSAIQGPDPGAAPKKDEAKAAPSKDDGKKDAGDKEDTKKDAPAAKSKDKDAKDK